MKIFYYIFLFFLFLLIVNGLNDLTWYWSDYSLRRCKELMGKEKVTRVLIKKGACEKLQDIVEDLFDGYGVSLNNVVEVSTYEELFKRSLEEPWKTAALKMFDDTIMWMIQEKTSDEEIIKRAYHPKFNNWMLKLIASDKNGLFNQNYDPSHLPKPSKPMRKKKVTS
jgi:hypothetical protein